MILAAPLVIPFAKAVGISVATLGMAKAADMVNDYIQANPEESMKILSTIVPSIGIGQIFMNKEKISLEDLDEMTDEEAQDLTKEEKAELMKQAGKSGGPNKRQTMIDISEKLGLSGEGKEKQDIEYDIDERYDEGGVEEVSKPKFDYKKFFRNRRADGGRVGFNLGGSLTGPALNIYNTMSAAGYFTDDEIRNAITAAGYEIPGASQPETTQPNIIGAQLNQGGGGGGGITELQKTFTTETAPPQFTGDPTAQLTGKGRLDPMGSGFYETLESLSAQPTGYTMSTFNKDFAPSGEVVKNESIDFNPETNPNVKKAFFQEVYQDPTEISFFDKVKDKFGSFKDKFFQPKVKGTLGTRLANQPRLPIPSFASFLSNYSSPFNLQSKNYNPLLESQLNFAETQEGIVGIDPNSGLLKYGPESVLSGKNVISMFGTNDYEEALMDYITKMNAYQTKKATDARAVKIQKAKDELAALQAATEAAKQAQYGKIDYGKGGDGQQSYSGDAIGAGNLGFGISATTGGPVSNKTGKGRTDYFKGGLASMFAEKR